MSEDLHGKQPIDPVIRAALRARQVAPSDGCLDPETLAAWIEGGLETGVGPQRAADVESHLADCARCQSILAALEESAEPAIARPGVVVPFAKPSPLRWLAPVAAGLAAASLVGWMVWPAQETASEPASQLAESVAPPTPAPAPAPAPAPESMIAAAPTPARAEGQAAAPRIAGAQATKPTAEAAAAKPAAAAAPPADPNRPPPKPLPMPAPPVAVQAAGAVASQLPPVPPPAAAPPPTTPPVSITADQAIRSDRNVLKVEQPSKYPIEFGPPVPAASRTAGGAGAGRGGGGGRAAGGVAARAMMTTAPPSVTTRWRILENGRVERRVNSGQTWTAVPLDGPVFITAGAAASPTVCWLVGHDGVVFRSIDGATFVRVTFPDAIDLTTVTTQDADRATVGTRDGRVFTTTDGGLTWRLY